MTRRYPRFLQMLVAPRERAAVLIGAIAEIAERLVERMYAQILLIPGPKRPGILVNDHWSACCDFRPDSTGARASSACSTARSA
jgi:hypothetical protein